MHPLSTPWKHQETWYIGKKWVKPKISSTRDQVYYNDTISFDDINHLTHDNKKFLQDVFNPFGPCTQYLENGESKQSLHKGFLKNIR